MEDDYSYDKIKKIYEQMNQSRTVSKYRDYDIWNTKWYTDDPSYVESIKIDYDYMKELKEQEYKREQEEKYRASCPHYVQVYGEDLPDGSVSTKWIRYEQRPNNFTNLSKYARSIVYQDGEDLFTYHRWKGENVFSKPIPLTEQEKKDFLFTMLRADNG